MNDEDLIAPVAHMGMSYPLMGAADHAAFCEKKLIDMGLADDYKVEVATDRTIQLDFDQPFEQMLPQQFFDALEIFARMLDVDQYGNPLPDGVAPKTASYRHLKSRSGRSHVIIDLSWDMPQAERIAWQAAMGSDFKREALSLAYAAMGQMSPVLLYSRKEEVSLVIPLVVPYKPAKDSISAVKFVAASMAKNLALNCKWCGKPIHEAAETKEMCLSPWYHNHDKQSPVCDDGKTRAMPTPPYEAGQ